MDLIYMNSLKADIGVLLDYEMDLAIGSDENNFECTVDTKQNVCQAGFYLYFEGTEYGGRIDSIQVDTDAKEVRYLGRTWHGILNSKVLEPDSGEDYLICNGEANDVIDELLVRMGLNALFSASNADSGININNYQMNRYIGGYEGIMKMLKSAGAKLHMNFENGTVILSALPLVDYAQDEQFDTDQIGFVIVKNYMPANHCICLGKGDLSEREVIHLYADYAGNISQIQSITGMDEVTIIYDYPNAESTEELIKGGTERIQESWNSDEVKFDFDSNAETYDVGDIVGATERITGISVAAAISKKIVTIKKGLININYKVGE